MRVDWVGILIVLALFSSCQMDKYYQLELRKLECVETPKGEL